MQMKYIKTITLSLVIILCAASFSKHKPTLFLIGDSTVRCGYGHGEGGLWGWGSPLNQFFDTSLINVENHAMGGTSSRTYRSFGLWQPVFDKINPGDYVLMQFGHNDESAINDSLRARGTIPGVGDETEEIDNILTGTHEVVHSYGWYMTQYIREIKAKGAIPMILSPIPRNDWIDQKVPLNNRTYGLWAKQVAEKEDIQFIDLNTKMALSMEELGEEKITGTLFFSHDNTHTTAEGAVFTASIIIEGIRELPHCRLDKYLLRNPVIKFPVE